MVKIYSNSVRSGTSARPRHAFRAAILTALPLSFTPIFKACFMGDAWGKAIAWSDLMADGTEIQYTAT